ncbi:MAG TPA: enolase C-terminal domain-like protein [Candidatus Polarisedimenticolia bacterium]|nr:enolase C-terminal domain-like protein [Candidatus Polarisedimenticolia bacterium]
MRRQPPSTDRGTSDVTIDAVEVSVYRVAADFPESDGTFEWDSTTMVLVDVKGGGERGLGYTYTHASAAELIRGNLAKILAGSRAMDINHSWTAMNAAVRNLGKPGIASSAIAAVDVALWDLKARLLGLPLVKLLGQVREEIPAYGSGGFTSYPPEKLYDQMYRWAQDGFKMVKMKIGRDPARDKERVRTAREAIGGEVQLFVDANGAYSPKQALANAEIFAGKHVHWFEEPVSSDDLEGLRFVRERAPAEIEIAAGEYGYDTIYFRRMLEAGAVDVLQVDATRCGGITGFLQAAALCDAFQIPLSAHTAPTLHQHVCCSSSRACHVEYFHDHARMEGMFFEGAARAVDGNLRPDLSRPGLGTELKRKDIEKYRIG